MFGFFKSCLGCCDLPGYDENFANSEEMYQINSMATKLRQGTPTAWGPVGGLPASLAFDQARNLYEQSHSGPKNKK